MYIFKLYKGCCIEVGTLRSDYKQNVILIAACYINDS